MTVPAAQSPAPPSTLRLQPPDAGLPAGQTLQARILAQTCQEEVLLLPLPALARIFAVELPALRKRVTRWQASRDRDPLHDDDAKPRGPKSFYNLRDVLPVISKMISETGPSLHAVSLAN